MSAATLVTAFTDRVDAHTVQMLTRQNDPANAGSNDSTKLTAAANDAGVRFAIHTGIAFDNDASGNKGLLHTAAGVELMMYYLVLRTRALDSAKRQWEENVLPTLDAIQKGRSIVVAVDAGVEQFVASNPETTLTPDFDEHGRFWEGVTTRDRRTRARLDEITPR